MQQVLGVAFVKKILTKFPFFPSFRWASVSAANSPGANCTSPLGGKLTSRTPFSSKPKKINPTGGVPYSMLLSMKNPYVPTRKFNIAGEIYHPKRKVVFQPSYFRGYVKLRGCNPWDESIRYIYRSECSWFLWVTSCRDKMPCQSQGLRMGYTGSLTGILTLCLGLSKNPHTTGDFIPKSKRPLAPMPLAPKH